MDPITLGIVTTAIGAVVTLAAKRWIFPFFENCFKHIKNFFSGTKTDNHSSIEKEKIEEEIPKKETEKNYDEKSITTNDKTIKNLKDNVDLKIYNTETSVDETAKQEHTDIDKATNKLMEVKTKLHNSGNHQITPEHHYHDHQIVGSHTKHVVIVEDANHSHHNGSATQKKDDEKAGR